MSEPTRLIVAGCNGSGKSSFSRLLASGFEPFDYDLQYLRFYKSLRDIDIRDEMAHNMTYTEFNRQIDKAITDKKSFCYETNFNTSPLHWPMQFKKHGYKLHLLYLCLDSILEAKKRVAIRVENGGHYVAGYEIEERYVDGFQNLNTHYQYFDTLDLFDTSGFAELPRHILSLENGNITIKETMPFYLETLIPNIVKKEF